MFKIPINPKKELDRVMGGVGRPEMSAAEFFELMCRDEVLPLRRIVHRMRVYFDLFQVCPPPLTPPAPVSQSRS